MRRTVHIVTAAVLSAAMFVLPATVRSPRTYLMWSVLAVAASAALGAIAEGMRLRDEGRRRRGPRSRRGGTLGRAPSAAQSALSVRPSRAPEHLGRLVVRIRPTATARGRIAAPGNATTIHRAGRLPCALPDPAPHDPVPPITTHGQGF